MPLGTWENAASRACVVELSKIKWEFCLEDRNASLFATMCQFPPALGSWLLCISDVLIEKSLDVRLQAVSGSVISLCRSTCLLRPENVLQAYNNASKYATSTQVYMAGLGLKPSALTEPIRLDSVILSQISVGWLYFLQNFDTSDMFARSLLWYIIGVIILCILSNNYLAVNNRRELTWFKRCFNRVRGTLTLPTITGKHSQPLNEGSRLFRCLAPTQGESLIILGFFTIHTIALAYGYHVDLNNSVFPSRSIQLLRLVGDRSGILSMAEMVLVIGMSTRNSILEWVCKWRYSNSMMLHKWVGRLCILDAIIHSLSYRIIVQLEGTTSALTSESYWRWGIGAIASGAILTITSVASIRAFLYEVFLLSHIILSICFLCFTWKHLRSFGFEGWVYLSAGICVTDHLLRIWRILKFGGGISARCDLITSVGQNLLIPADADAVKVLIRLSIPKPRDYDIRPGQYVFLYFQIPRTPWTWWQSHPFTVVEDQGHGSCGSELIVVLRPKNGMTKALLTHAKTHSAVKVLVEGPYGPPASSQGFDLLIAGGSGIPGPLSSAIEQQRPAKFVIVVRDEVFLEAWRIQLMNLRRSSIEILVYVTGSTRSDTYGTASSTILADLSRFAKVLHGRPDIPSFLRDFLDIGVDQVSVTCCGPPALVDNTRDAIARISRGHPSLSIGYSEEYQIW